MADQDNKTQSLPVRDETPQSSNRAKTAESEQNSAGQPSHRSREESQAEEPSGYRGENPSTAGPGGTGIRSATPENAGGHINPSAPGDTGTTPGTTPRE